MLPVKLDCVCLQLYNELARVYTLLASRVYAHAHAMHCSGIAFVESTWDVLGSPGGPFRVLEGFLGMPWRILVGFWESSRGSGVELGGPARSGRLIVPSLHARKAFGDPWGSLDHLGGINGMPMPLGLPLGGF